jgi:hypothetical protein
LNYVQDEIAHFKFNEILGCNWTEDKTSVAFEISLKEGKVNIGIPRANFYDFKTRMFAITGMNE